MFWNDFCMKVMADRPFAVMPISSTVCFCFTLPHLYCPTRSSVSDAITYSSYSTARYIIILVVQSSFCPLPLHTLRFTCVLSCSRSVLCSGGPAGRVRLSSHARMDVQRTEHR